ncbi:MAG: hypothetical protein QM692_18060 [Thermomicrobiales bacterium]
MESGITYVRVVSAALPHLLEDAINMALEMEIVEGARVVDVRISSVPSVAPPRDGSGPSAGGGQWVALILLSPGT